jgi:hypothetical protein
MMEQHQIWLDGLQEKAIIGLPPAKQVFDGCFRSVVFFRIQGKTWLGRESACCILGRFLAVLVDVGVCRNSCSS